ncbi:hypothetical protein EN850_03050 [Mesorhizobium sp. M8A.F.Ca.ET.207.01.1.1]|uniref:hypothetical protein n=1 Tax=Mesorhizobium sp. M8A.F.Ca.ET.207.01.1.1 TaxID=2563968 RepID=UPI00109D52DC|nr:hypothetical protein [Mesorhizobium sp. M8A.F.Ca.ET.207.01.1.1]TGQ83736.1 hypothetical protein EN850_03050 [Mesorhizobium sp. M8A.F.Ca.ET.207.01.1.1]
MADALWDNEISRWIIGKIPVLDDRSQYRADNSVRFALWAKEFREASPPIASFCALHAVEEAVAAFISAAKTCGHRERAKIVNIHDHLSKALVSIFAARASLAANQGRLAIAVHPDGQSLAYRLPKGDGYAYNRLHLSVFHVDFDGTSEAGDRNLLGQVPLLDDIEAEVKRVADARNGVLYASDAGSPIGFLDLETEVNRATSLCLGLIWGSVDLHLDPAQGGAFVQMILDKMIDLNTARIKPKKSDLN